MLTLFQSKNSWKSVLEWIPKTFLLASAKLGVGSTDISKAAVENSPLPKTRDGANDGGQQEQENQQNKIHSQHLHYSPTDLTLFMRSPFASWMNRYARQCPEQAPERDIDAGLVCVLQSKGYQHEKVQEDIFISQGLSVLHISDELAQTRKAKKLSTIEAMQHGIDVICQARLEYNQFAGYADFLMKVPGCSNLGDYHYEVWDTKLSRKPKPEYIMQLCCYAEMLESIQGRRPAKAVIVVGNCTATRASRLLTHRAWHLAK